MKIYCCVFSGGEGGGWAESSFKASQQCVFVFLRCADAVSNSRRQASCTTEREQGGETQTGLLRGGLRWRYKVTSWPPSGSYGMVLKVRCHLWRFLIRNSNIKWLHCKSQHSAYHPPFLEHASDTLFTLLFVGLIEDARVHPKYKPANSGPEQTADSRPCRRGGLSSLLKEPWCGSGWCMNATALWFEPVLKSHTFLHVTVESLEVGLSG